MVVYVCEIQDLDQTVSVLADRHDTQLQTLVCGSYVRIITCVQHVVSDMAATVTVIRLMAWGNGHARKLTKDPLEADRANSRVQTAKIDSWNILFCRQALNVCTVLNLKNVQRCINQV